MMPTFRFHLLRSRVCCTTWRLSIEYHVLCVAKKAWQVMRHGRKDTYRFRITVRCIDVIWILKLPKNCIQTTANVMPRVTHTHTHTPINWCFFINDAQGFFYLDTKKKKLLWNFDYYDMGPSLTAWCSKIILKGFTAHSCSVDREREREEWDDCG